MADLVVDFLLNKLREVVGQERYADLIGGAEQEQELEQLMNELGLCKSFLAEEENKLRNAEVFREIERHIRGVVYEAEDTIDACLMQAAKSQENHGFTRFSMKFVDQKARSRVSLAMAIKSLGADKMRPVLERIDRYAQLQVRSAHVPGLHDIGPAAQAFQHPSFAKDNVVVLGDEQVYITRLILEPKDDLDVISIIGMPGLGKTTLAWRIYESKMIKYNFPVRVWVYVSEVLNKRDVLLTILKEFTSQDMSQRPIPGPGSSQAFERW